jgi:putative membrane protein
MKTNFPITLSLVVLAAATLWFVVQANYEFLLYAVTLLVLIGIVFRLNRRFGLPAIAKWGFFAWMVLHMAGGGVYLHGTRLYDVVLVPLVGSPYDILKYDQFVHFFCYLVMTLLVFPVFKSIVAPGASRLVFGVLLVLAASSIGAVNEIIEFAAVVLFQADGVGGYHNTCIDLVANLLGAMVSTVYLAVVRAF